MTKKGVNSMIVHNIKGTSNRKPYGYDSWIDFWMSKKDSKPTYCNCGNCLENKDLVGAHVQEDGKDTRKFWYILPLCREHNHYTNTEPFEVFDVNELVRVTEDD